MYRLIAYPLEVFYGLWPNYAGAISLLTLSIMILLLPLTLKGTRSMLAMQKLQPEMKKLQAKHRDDRQKLNEEMMLFYKENNINPLSGCLPLLLQMPVFFVLYRTLYELLNRAPYGQDMGAAVARSNSGVNGGVFENFGVFYPKHLNESSDLYRDLHAATEMKSFGINLADTAWNVARNGGLVKAAPFVLMVLAVTATSYYQQKQIAGRNPQAASVNPQQQMLMKIMPLFFAFISMTLPAGIVVYFLVSNLFRIGQQGLITRTMYRDEDGPVSTTGRESDKTSKKGGAPAPKPKGFLSQMKEIGLPDPAKAKREVAESKAKRSPSGSGAQNKKVDTSKKAGATKQVDTAKKVDTTKPKAPSRGAAGPSRAAPASPNRSKNKKKRK